MMVCKVAELRGYDRVVQVSALLHDIGKPQSRKINPKNNHVNFWGHEELSAKMAEPLVADLVTREMLSRKEGEVNRNIEEILDKIIYHSRGK
jgi:putative nucleotidyltransferase with HDIG domain